MLNYREIDCVELVRKVINNFKGVAAAKEIEIISDLPEKEVRAEVDEDRIIQVLANLMSNALRHTPPGKEIKVALSGEDEGLVRIELADRGPGINPEDRPFIFDRFYRGSKSRNRADGGAGLGLAIAKSLVEAHGGRIEVDCPAGGGTLFGVILPVARKSY